MLRHGRLVERGIHVDNGLLSVFLHGVQPSQPGHRQDHIANFAVHIDVALVAQHVLGDTPELVRDPVQSPVALVPSDGLCVRDIIDRFRERGGQPMIEQRLKDVLTSLLGREDSSIVVKLDI